MFGEPIENNNIIFAINDMQPIKYKVSFSILLF